MTFKYDIYTFDGATNVLKYKSYFSFDTTLSTLKDLRAHHVTAFYIKSNQNFDKIELLERAKNLHKRNLKFWKDCSVIDQMTFGEMKELAENFKLISNDLDRQFIEQNTGFSYDSILYAYEKIEQTILHIIDTKKIATIRHFAVVAISDLDNKSVQIKVPKKLKNAKLLTDKIEELVKEYCCEEGI